MVITAVIFVYAITSTFEIIALKKANKKKELIVFIIFMLMAFILSMLIALDVKIPSINRLIDDFITSILNKE